MSRRLIKLSCAGLGVIAAVALILLGGRSEAAAGSNGQVSPVYEQRRPIIAESRFDVEVLVNGYPLEEYNSRGRWYVEAVAGSEYEVRIRNPLPYRVAVALSVDGLNSIDARRTSAWNASKWVIEPYGTIQIGGWQMSSERARRFYFTTERDSYAAKLGQTSNLGLISAVFFRELRRVPIQIAPPPRPYPQRKEGGARQDRQDGNDQAPAASAESGAVARDRRGSIASQPDDGYAATGIGRSVRNDVHWVNMDLDSRAAAEVTIRYEYYSALVRLGILPRPYYQPDPLRRREGATGFQDRRFSPEP